MRSEIEEGIVYGQLEKSREAGTGAKTSLGQRSWICFKISQEADVSGTV